MKKTEWFNGKRYIMNNNFFEAFYNYTSHASEIEIHSHDFFEMLFFLKGNVTFYVEDKTYNMRPGDILLTNSRELHKASIKQGESYERYVMWVHPDFILSVSGFLNEDMSKCFSSDDERHDNLIRVGAYEFEEIVSKIKRLPLNIENKDRIILPCQKCIAAEILSDVSEAYKKYASRSDEDFITNPKINDIVLYINGNLCEDLSLETLSKKFYISKYHLTRQFKIHTGLNLHKFILTKRLNNARIMIGEGTDLYQAAFESGFNNYSHFSRIFKENCGVSPTEYKEA